MTGTIPTPTVGQPDSTEDVKVANAVTAINNLLTSSNLIDGTQLGSGTVAGAAIADSGITTAKIANANVTVAKLQSLPMARVTHNADQSITTNTETTVAFNTETFDTDVIHDTVTNNSRLTCKTAGVYSIGASVYILSGSTVLQSAYAYFYLNATTYIGGTEIGYDALNGQTADVLLNPTALYKLAVNDYLEVRVLAKVASGTLNVKSTAAFSPAFWMNWVGSGV